MEERCICCGEIIPEGRQVCPSCEAETKKKIKTQNLKANFT
jgi:predicted nucleic acid-binding Zn ribbon protein